MPVSIPLVTSQNNYRLAVPLQNETFLFDVRCNTRDAAWYFDLRREDETPILMNNKVVVGARPGHSSNDSFYKTRVMQVVDISDTGVDPSYDELGTRVLVVVSEPNELSPL